VFIFLFISLHTCVECSIWNEESSHSKSDQNQELEEPETEKKKSHWLSHYGRLPRNQKLLCKKKFHIYKNSFQL